MHLNRRRVTTLLALAILAPATTLLATDPAPPPADDLQQLNTTLLDPGSSSTQREESARRLLQRTSLAATLMLQDVLRSERAPAQIAAAKAIATDPNPDPSFIPLLNSLLGPSVPLTREAARALANYPNQPDVIADLRSALTSQRVPEASRVQIMRALGLIIDKSVASFLVDRRANDRSPALQSAAGDALGEMSGLHDNGQPDFWQTWWNKSAGKSAAAWRADLLSDRLRDFTQTRQHYNALTDELRDLLDRQYSMIGDPKTTKSEAILQYLQSPAPEIRVDGIQLVYDDVIKNGHPIADDVREHLRSMIGDSDRDVRYRVAQTLGAINDVGASTALIAQLNQETDPKVRFLIAQALDESGDLRAVPSLITMLDDPSIEDATAAATALADMGDKLRQDKSKADMVKQAVAALQKTFDRTKTAGAPPMDLLRAACASALAAMGSPESMPTFQQILTRPNESSDVRRGALRGLGNLADPHTTALIAGSLTDAAVLVRLDAAVALRKVATFLQADQLFRMLNKDEEPDSRVRDAVWNDLKMVLRKGSPSELNGWADRFKDDPEKQLEVLQSLRNALINENDQKQLAITDQTIGDVLLTKLNRPQDAIGSLQSALNYWQGSGTGEAQTLLGLVSELLDAQLAAGKYQEAVDFAGKEIAISPQYQDTVGPKIKNEADRLRGSNVNEKDKALRLIDAAMKMPKEQALDAKYQRDLQQIQQEINQTPPGAP